MYIHMTYGSVLKASTLNGLVPRLLFMLLGCSFVLIFQVNLTWMAGLTSVATVGIIGGLKVIPQWTMNAIFQFKALLRAS